jgi:hypothetical protein
MLDTAPKRRWFRLRPTTIAISVWLSLTAAATALGGFASLYTGKASDLPQWNGWSYLLFCAREGAMVGGTLALPIALVVFLFLWFA